MAAKSFACIATCRLMSRKTWKVSLQHEGMQCLHADRLTSMECVVSTIARPGLASSMMSHTNLREMGSMPAPTPPRPCLRDHSHGFYPS